MPTFSAGNGAFTPATTGDNWTLDSTTTAGVLTRITQISWGGSNPSSNGYRTRWSRPTAAGTGSITAITLTYSNPNYRTAGASVAQQSGYATTQPTLATDPGANLFAMDWNNQGGSGILVLPLAQPWWCIGGTANNGQQISCRNTKGVDASLSSYNLTWEED